MRTIYPQHATPPSVNTTMLILCIVQTHTTHVTVEPLEMTDNDLRMTNTVIQDPIYRYSGAYIIRQLAAITVLYCYAVTDGNAVPT